MRTALDKCLDRRLTFACWRAPGSAFHLAVQYGPELAVPEHRSLSGERNVFIVHPFHHAPTEVLRPDLVLTFEDRSLPDIDILDEPLFQGGPDPDPPPGAALDQAGHEGLVRKSIEAIRSGTLEKVVISRTIVLDLGGATVADLFLEASERHPDAFLCLFRSPGYGLWLGASPERLVRAEEDRVEVDAIAGTLPTGEAPATAAEWGVKERHEQELVTRAVLDAFLSEGIREVTVRGPEVLVAGPVSHLYSRITGKLPANGLVALVHALHPTPAVGGSPKERSRTFIAANEPGPRGLYAGFWGPWQWYGRTELAVNIRCLQVVGGQAVLHVGGGITAESDAGAEWRETEAKALTWRKTIDAASPR